MLLICNEETKMPLWNATDLQGGHKKSNCGMLLICNEETTMLLQNEVSTVPTRDVPYLCESTIL